MPRPTKKKPSTKASKTAPTRRVNWKKAAIALASCVDFALRFDKHLGRGSGQVIDLKTMKSKGPWQERFFDALELVGLVYDRKGYYEAKEHKRRV